MGIRRSGRSHSIGFSDGIVSDHHAATTRDSDIVVAVVSVVVECVVFDDGILDSTRDPDPHATTATAVTIHAHKGIVDNGEVEKSASTRLGIDAVAGVVVDEYIVPDDQAIDLPVNRLHRETKTHSSAGNDVVRNIENILLENYVARRSPGLCRIDVRAGTFCEGDVMNIVLANRVTPAEVSDPISIIRSRTPWNSLKRMANVVRLHKTISTFDHDTGHFGANDPVAAYRIITCHDGISVFASISPDAFIASVVNGIVQDLIVRSVDKHADTVRKSAGHGADIKSNDPGITRIDREAPHDYGTLASECNG